MSELEEGLKEYVKKLIHPWDNWDDYVRYGDMFIELKLNE